MKGMQRWTQQEDEDLYARRKAGETMIQIAAAMRRSEHSVEARWRWLHITDEERARRRTKEYLRRHKNTTHKPKAEPPVRRGRVESEIRIYPKHVFVDRAAREATPRTLTQIICGDPIPGWSALDRKLAGVTA